MLACGVACATIVGCNGPHRVTIINHGPDTVKAAKVDTDGNEKAIIYMTGPSGGELFLRDGESFVMGDAKVTLDGSQILVANGGMDTLTTSRSGYSSRMLIGPGAVGYYQCSDGLIAIDGIEVGVKR